MLRLIIFLTYKKVKILIIYSIKFINFKKYYLLFYFCILLKSLQKLH